jgi:poly-gamma-glutamate capsule biosynthesis protein CapA/YwtB (metallophosphatase superfamily)
MPTLLRALLIAPLLVALPLFAPAPARAQQAPPAPAPAPDTLLSRGQARAAAKDWKGALALFDQCVKEGGPDAISCRWERGWVHWMRADWAKVVTDWEVVKKADPQRPDLDKYLYQAIDNKSLEAVLERGRKADPAAFVSQAPKGATLRLRAVGDMMISTDFPEGVINPEIGATFADVKPWLKDADLTFGNLEGPLCDRGETTKCKPEAPAGACYAFRTPGRYAPLYTDAGFDVLSTANNHAEDFGRDCRIDTEALLDKEGIKHSGRPGDIASMTVNGLKVAVIGFHTNRNSHYVNDHKAAALIVKAMAAEHDIVLVSFHGGAEGSKALHVPDGPEVFYGEERGDLRRFARAVIDAGADIVIGHGPHVLRGMEVYKGRLIAYSLGNFATYGRFNVKGNAGIGVVLEATLDREGRFVKGLALPTKQLGAGVPAKDPEAQAVALLRDLSAQDFGATAVLVGEDGALRAPVAPAPPVVP